MGFIQNIIQKHKSKKEFAYKMQCSYAISSLDIHIKDLDRAIKTAKSNKQQSPSEPISFEDYDRIKWYTDVVCRHYSRFLNDLKQKEIVYSCTHFENVKKKLKQKIDYMHNLKKRYQSEFEIIEDAYTHLINNENVKSEISIKISNTMHDGFDLDDHKYKTLYDHSAPLK